MASSVPSTLPPRKTLPTPGRMNVSPREEEGRETLPDYSCSITAEAPFECKLEMVSPFERSEARSWTEVYAVLRGTALDLHETRWSLQFGATGRDRPAEIRAGLLIRSYTLQYAEVGVAADYHKRPLVMRVRAEGEQFLLSCTDLEVFVTWIEALSTAIGIALPIDQRTYPRYRTLPVSHSQPRIEFETEESQREIARQHFPHLLEGDGLTPPSSSSVTTTITAGGSSSNGNNSSSSSSMTRRLANVLRGGSPSSDDARQHTKQRSREERRPAPSSIDAVRATVELDIMLGVGMGCGSTLKPPSNRRARSRGDNNNNNNSRNGSSNPRSSSPSPHAGNDYSRNHRRSSSSTPSTTSSSSSSASASTSATSTSPSSQDSLSSSEDDIGENNGMEERKTGGRTRGIPPMDAIGTMNYARRCFRHLNEFSARRHDVVVKNGKLWRIDWETQTLRRCRL
ncbi:MAG: hypothetical protein M1823_001457 [Watsoniomyces obsoletus]|nr:MAG: hypothetical protein M1823_001457 [Watsoniomyces obsoletus]